MCAVESD